MKVSFVLILIFGLGIQAWGRGSQCSNVYQIKLGDSPNQQNVIQLSFEKQVQAQLFTLSNLQKLGNIQSNSQHNEILANVAWTLNRLLDDYVTTMQYAHENLTPESRKILIQYVARHEKFFLNLMGGDKEGLIRLIKARLHALQSEWQNHSNSLPTIGFIQNGSNSSGPSSRSLPTIGFIQPDKTFTVEENPKSKRLPTIGFIQDPQNTQTEPNKKLPSIGFIQPSTGNSNETKAATTRRPIGFVRNSESSVDVGYRFKLVIDEKFGIFDLARLDYSIGFIKGN
jgi:hypothetical protein